LTNLTPFQPTGPYFHVMLRGASRGVDVVAPASCPGRHVAITGVVLDGAGAPVTDALVEVWQADGEGRYRHAEDPRCGEVDPGFRGFGRTATDDKGRFRFETIKPGPVAGPGGTVQAPHVLVSLMAPGILTRRVTRVYFEDEAATRADPILALVPAGRRRTLVASRAGEAAYRLDIVLQGEGETVFFDA
jgi:protocatechuate 3,4-dioxygenase alpha subunit